MMAHRTLLAYQLARFLSALSYTFSYCTPAALTRVLTRGVCFASVLSSLRRVLLGRQAGPHGTRRAHLATSPAVTGSDDTASGDATTATRCTMGATTRNTAG